MWPTRREERRLTREALLAALATLASTQALPAQPPLPAADPAARPRSGLLLRSEASEAAWTPAPELSTAIQARIDGLVARTTIEQRFTNPGDERVDAVYLFPLPEDAAVDTFEMRIGERRIIGEIHERQRAKRIYETARQQGKKTSLVEQERPNLFTVSVAGIAAGETIAVRLRYQELVRFDLGAFHLRIPLVAAPRYEPALLPVAMRTALGLSAPATPAVITAPPDRIERPLTLTVDLAPGLPLSALSSPTHAVRVLPGTSPDSWRIGFAAAALPADRDFELVWKPRQTAMPSIVRFDQSLAGARFAGILFVPPALDENPERLPRELVIVLDTSGSMGGASIEQAKQAVRAALARLRPEDRFDLIRFSDEAQALFPASVDAGPHALAAAEEFLARTRADGGTNIRSALEQALVDVGNTATVRQILFVTDGCVGNEEELFGLLERRLGDNRLFTVGIGSAPNSYFMTRAARLGRGTFTFIGQSSQVEAKMEALFRKLEAPVLSDIEVQWNDPGAETYPMRVPDLYLGEPLLVLARLVGDNEGARVLARRGQDDLEVDLPAGQSTPSSGLDRLWARRKIDALEDAAREPGADADALRNEIVRVALASGIVSRYTSFVAVEQVPTSAPGTAPTPRRMASLPPAGWSGALLPQGGTSAPLLRRVALAAALLGLALRPLARLWS